MASTKDTCKFYSIPDYQTVYNTKLGHPEYTFTWDAYKPSYGGNKTQQKVEWPKTNIDVDVIIQYLVKDGVPDIQYGRNIRLLLDSCTWTTTEQGSVKLVIQDDKKKMLNCFVNTFSNVDETIFWLKFADDGAINDRMEKVRVMVALDG